MDNTSGTMESRDDLPDKVTCGKENVLLFQKKIAKITEQV